MINQINTSIPQSKPISFTSKSDVLRPIDDIGRLVIREFPLISESKLVGFNSLQKKQNFKNYRKYVCKGISTLRTHTDSIIDNSKYLLSELDAMKRFKLGNCSEMADAAYTALKMNGYENAEIMWMYAYNPKTKVVRDLDHVVVGVNFNKPENYTYCPLYQMYFDKPSPNHLLSGGNKGIVIDTWAGTTDYGKNMGVKYNHNKALIRYYNEKAKGLGKSQYKTLLQNGEEIRFAPIEKSITFSPDDWAYINLNYSNLYLPENRKLAQCHKISTDYKIPQINEFNLTELKSRYGLKGAPTPEEIREHSQITVDNWLTSRGYYQKNRETKEHSNIFEKLKDFITSKIF